MHATILINQTVQIFNDIRESMEGTGGQQGMLGVLDKYKSTILDSCNWPKVKAKLNDLLDKYLR
jgi:hypothetical protein